MTKKFKFNIDVKYVRYEREEHSVSCETEAEAIELAKQYASSMKKDSSNEEYVENFIITEDSMDYYEFVNMEGDIIV